MNLIMYSSTFLTQSYNVDQITKKGLVVPWRLSQLHELEVLEPLSQRILAKLSFCDKS